MREEKPAIKILRSPFKIFDIKMSIIEEASDILKMKVDELIGSLLTVEIFINDKYEKKTKGVAFKTSI